MSDDEPDINQLAHRIVRDATEDDGPPCDRCRTPMESKTRRERLSGAFGGDTVYRERGYWECPNCGYTVR